MDLRPRLCERESIYINRMSEQISAGDMRGITHVRSRPSTHGGAKNCCGFSGTSSPMHPGLLVAYYPRSLILYRLKDRREDFRWFPELRDAAEASEWTDFSRRVHVVIAYTRCARGAFVRPSIRRVADGALAKLSSGFVYRTTRLGLRVSRALTRSSLPSSWLEVRHTPPEISRTIPARVFALARHIEAGLVLTDAASVTGAPGLAHLVDVSAHRPHAHQGRLHDLWADRRAPRLVRERSSTPSRPPEPPPLQPRL